MAGSARPTGSYRFGVPPWPTATVLSELSVRFPTEPELDQFLDSVVNRITDKSGALLQTASIFGAIAAFLIDKQVLPLLPATPAAFSSALAPLATLTVASLLLALNLGMYWPRIRFNAAEVDGQRGAWRLAMVREIQRRSVRLTVAMWLVFVSLPLSLIDVRAIPWDEALAALMRLAPHSAAPVSR